MADHRHRLQPVSSNLSPLSAPTGAHLPPMTSAAVVTTKTAFSSCHSVFVKESISLHHEPVKSTATVQSALQTQSGFRSTTLSLRGSIRIY